MNSIYSYNLLSINQMPLLNEKIQLQYNKMFQYFFSKDTQTGYSLIYKMKFNVFLFNLKISQSTRPLFILLPT